MSAYIVGPKQEFAASLGTSDTIVGIVHSTFGARYLLARAHDATTVNPITFGAAQACLDGTNATCVNAPIAISGFGSGARADTAPGAWGIWATNIATSPGVAFILYPFVRVFASAPAGATLLTIDIWPVYDASHPNCATNGGVFLV